MTTRAYRHASPLSPSPPPPCLRHARLEEDQLRFNRSYPDQPILPSTDAMSARPSPLPSRQATPQPPMTLDPRSITSPDQIAAQLALLSKRESELSVALNNLVSDRSSIENALAHLQDLGEDIHLISLEVDGGGPSTGLGLHNGSDALMHETEGGLVERVRRVWETSERVGGKVRRLDEEVGRVKEAADIVTEVLELKASGPAELAWRELTKQNALQTLTTAIAKSDWESASRSCRRAMDVRKEVIEGGFAGAVVVCFSTPCEQVNTRSLSAYRATTGPASSTT